MKFCSSCGHQIAGHGKHRSNVRNVSSVAASAPALGTQPQIGPGWVPLALCSMLIVFAAHLYLMGVTNNGIQGPTSQRFFSVASLINHRPYIENDQLPFTQTAPLALHGNFRNAAVTWTGISFVFWSLIRSFQQAQAGGLIRLLSLVFTPLKWILATRGRNWGSILLGGGLGALAVRALDLDPTSTSALSVAGLLQTTTPVGARVARWVFWLVPRSLKGERSNSKFSMRSATLLVVAIPFGAAASLALASADGIVAYKPGDFGPCLIAAGIGAAVLFFHQMGRSVFGRILGRPMSLAIVGFTTSWLLFETDVAYADDGGHGEFTGQGLWITSRGALDAMVQSVGAAIGGAVGVSASGVQLQLPEEDARNFVSDARNVKQNVNEIREKSKRVVDPAQQRSTTANTSGPIQQSHGDDDLNAVIAMAASGVIGWKEAKSKARRIMTSAGGKARDADRLISKIQSKLRDRGLVIGDSVGDKKEINKSSERTKNVPKGQKAAGSTKPPTSPSAETTDPSLPVESQSEPTRRRTSRRNRGVEVTTPVHSNVTDEISELRRPGDGWWKFDDEKPPKNATSEQRHRFFEDRWERRKAWAARAIKYLRKLVLHRALLEQENKRWTLTKMIDDYFGVKHRNDLRTIEQFDRRGDYYVGKALDLEEEIQDYISKGRMLGESGSHLFHELTRQLESAAEQTGVDLTTLHARTKTANMMNAIAEGLTKVAVDQVAAQPGKMVSTTGKLAADLLATTVKSVGKSIGSDADARKLISNAVTDVTSKLFGERMKQVIGERQFEGIRKKIVEGTWKIVISGSTETIKSGDTKKVSLAMAKEIAKHFGGVEGHTLFDISSSVHNASQGK